MSNELAVDYGITAKTVYFLLRTASNTIWNGATFESYTPANYATYPITATEQGASGYYVGSMPGTTAGIFNVTAKQQIGGSPAQGDLSIGDAIIEWDGVLVSSGVGTLINDVANCESTAAVHSLLTAVLKLVSKFNLDPVGLVATTYKTNGSSAKMTQAVTPNTNLLPTQSLGVGA